MNRFLAAAVFVTALAGPGCVTWEWNDATPREWPPPRSAVDSEPTLIATELDYEIVGATLHPSVRGPHEEALNRLIFDAFNGSGWFTLTRKKKRARYLVGVRIRQHLSNNIGFLVLAIWTVAVIPLPGPAGDHVYEFVVIEGDGTKLGEFRLTSSYRTMTWMPLLFATPFFWMSSVAARSMSEVFRDAAYRTRELIDDSRRMR